MVGIGLWRWGWRHGEVRGSVIRRYYPKLWARCLMFDDKLTHCASRPPCVMVTMILSEKEVQVTSVSTPWTRPVACLVVAG